MMLRKYLGKIKRRKHLFLWLLCCFLPLMALAQNPAHFTYDDEADLPSNEVYSIAQDSRGFIWIGCDAGLYKFDGVRYIGYKCATQSSKSITGLRFSASGKLYCYNFKSQIFCLENDTLREISGKFSKIVGLETDQLGNVFVNHSNGLAQYAERSRRWTNYKDFDADNRTNLAVSACANARNQLYFIAENGLGMLQNGKIDFMVSEYFRSVGIFVMADFRDEHFIFSTYRDVIFRQKDGRLTELRGTRLNSILQHRKITNVVALPDGFLWICTYKGLVRYRPDTDEVRLFYPEISFSDCLIDREGSYWFTTLQTGIMRVPDLRYVVWNKENELIPNDKITKITTDGTHIFFATINGIIGQLNITTNALKTFYTGQNADAQSLDYEPKDNCIYFNINRHLFCLKNDKITQKYNDVLSLKSIVKVNNDDIKLSSFGVHVQPNSSEKEYKISESWTRELQYNAQDSTIWIASNDGLFKANYLDGKWKILDTFLPDIQILSVYLDKQSLYVLTFDNQIFRVVANQKPVRLARLSANVQAKKIKVFQDKMYVATSKGVWIFDLRHGFWQNLNIMSGLVAENIQDLLIINGNMWIGTGKGLQQIPLNVPQPQPLAKIYLKNTPASAIEYGQALLLHPEVSAYRSNGKFQYAYRLSKTKKWVLLPATVPEISIENLETGNFEIELKAIDYFGRDSENLIRIKGYVRPPVWKTWWFLLLLALLLSAIIFLIVIIIIKNIRKKEQTKTELINSQLKAIRAQMNPHFMYNTLNSIQDLIFQNDIKKTNYYLSKFSLLMRQVLAFSEEEKVLLSEELQMLQNYLELEKLRFGDDFSFEIQVKAGIDTERIYIPSLIVQPYLENALKHGLLHKKGQKIILVTVNKNDNSLEINVQDNGVGRKRSAEINQRRGALHKSFATHAALKRVELLNDMGHQKIEVQVTDVYTQEPDTGTNVCIKIFLQ